MARKERVKIRNNTELAQMYVFVMIEVFKIVGEAYPLILSDNRFEAIRKMAAHTIRCASFNKPEEISCEMVNLPRYYRSHGRRMPEGTDVSDAILERCVLILRYKDDIDVAIGLIADGYKKSLCALGVLEDSTPV